MEHTFLTDRGESIRLTPKASSLLGAGGQGQVHSTRVGRELMAVKLMGEVEADKLRALQTLEGTCGAVATLPQRLLFHARGGRCGRLAGYAMRLVDGRTSVSAACLFNVQQIRLLPHYTWADAVLAALRLAEAVALLHRNGIVIGDLNPENVLYEATTTLADTASWRAVLLDTDSFQIQDCRGRRHPCPVGRPLYTAPELIGCDLNSRWRENSADGFSLAVLIYQLLLHDHPYDNAINDNEPDLEVTEKIRRGLYPHAAVTPPGLRPGPFRPAPGQISDAIDLAFRRSFSSADQQPTPSLRPSAAEWVDLLLELHGQLVPCRRSRHHHHPRGQACLWCGVDERCGQSISCFPNAHPQSGAGAVPRAVAPVPPASADGGALLRQYGELHQQLLAHRQRCRWLVALRSDLATRLLHLESEVVQRRARYGEPSQWIQQQDLERRLCSPAARLRRALQGRSSSDAERQASLRELLAVVEAAVRKVRIFSTWLECRQRDLLKRLAAMDLAPLEDDLPMAAEDPAAAVLAELEAAVERQRQTWLRRRLEQELLCHWRIEGLGTQRRALLEGHGLLHAEHLRLQIDRLTELPGIGKGIQRKLSNHLEAVIARHQHQRDDHPLPLVMDDLVAPAMVLQLTALENDLLDLQRDIDEAEEDLQLLDNSLARQALKRDRLLNAFLAVS